MTLAKFLPLLLALVYAWAMYRFSVWRTGRLLDAKSHPLNLPEINRLTRRMADALGLPELRVHVFDVDPVNGLAAPDGRIFLTRGFVQKYRTGEVTAEEMASVIAHELGHVALGHTRRRMIDFTGANALFVMLTALLSRFIPFIGVLIANAISSALVARLSRRDEHEADAYASALLVKAGIGTGPQKSLFRKLDHMTGNHGANVPEWLRSHPQTTERVARIEEREARWAMGREA
ncbi:M48 family metallopeptidase [Aliigemmobacter aestuarii]|uniref:M48 family metallopeptidase n=1 Tax=Aliigemmobacter aestuarii TaxID=1445661 RepID=A0A4S3MS47_9RHOB|nr:M48 family metallopeptidase [Gemmobacter aestuarii]THD84261.1 M48 family metallopeptidase [Gemmobacter aestuarii]